MPVGTSRLAPVTNMREKCLTVAVFSASGPTMKPGVSHRNSIGSPNASHSCMNRAALSAPSASIAPPRCAGLLAITPSGRPSLGRASAVTMPAPKPRRSSSTSSSSASITVRMS